MYDIHMTYVDILYFIPDCFRIPQNKSVLLHKYSTNHNVTILLANIHPYWNFPSYLDYMSKTV